MTRILVFGDSIANGKWDPDGGWVQKLSNYCDRKSLLNENYDISIYNLSISGNISTNILKRFEYETKQRKSENIYLFFAFGVNDPYLISIDKFRKNVQKIIKKSKKYTSKIIFLGPTPVEESKTNPVPWNEKAYYKNEEIQKYNEILKEISIKNSLFFIDIFNRISKINYKILLTDGLHPNTKGHELIFKMVKEFLTKNKLI